MSVCQQVQSNTKLKLSQSALKSIQIAINRLSDVEFRQIETEYPSNSVAHIGFFSKLYSIIRHTTRLIRVLS